MGAGIVGFGHQVMMYESGREFDWMHVAFSPRKANLTLYVFNDSPKQEEFLAALGKFTRSQNCLYINRLSDVDEKVLENLIRDSIEHSRN